jgi:hypothetical protein
MHRLLALPLLVVTVALVALPVTATAAPQGEAVDGGTAPTQATAIEAGTAYSDDIRPGEARWFSLDVDEGQELGATLTEYGETEYNCCLKVELSDPDFDPIRSDLGNNTTGTAQTLRTETDEDGVDESGTYYLSVQLDSDTSTRAVAFDFSVDVAGEGMLTSSASPTSEATGEASASASASPEATSPPSEETGTSPLLWGVVGVLALLLLVLLGLVAVLLKRLGSSRS